MFSSKKVYLYTLLLLLAMLPAGAFADLLSDVFAVFWTFNALAGPGQVVLAALVFAIPFAAFQANRGWSLQPFGENLSEPPHSRTDQSTLTE